MPRKLIVYGCEFKCGQKVVLSKKAMDSHESRCFSNPAKRACKGCANFSSHMYSNGMELEPQFLETWRQNECSEDLDIQEKLKYDCNKFKPKQRISNGLR